MTKKKLLLIPLLCGLLFVSSGCDNLGGGNTGIYQSYALVGFNIQMGGTTLSTEMGEIAASDPGLALLEGECVFLNQFTIDYDNQPSSKYYTATDITYQEISRSPFYELSPVQTDGYDLLMTKVGCLYSSFFKGNIMVGSDYTKTKDQSVSYRLIYDRMEPAENGVVNLYLQAKLVGATGGSTENVSDVRAVNISDLIYTAGKDTIINSVSGKYVKANLKYLTKIEDGEPVYDTAVGPVEIVVFNGD
jgi:hypothetical protein